MGSALPNIDSPSSMPSLESVWNEGRTFLAHCGEGEGPATFSHPVADEDPLFEALSPGTVVAVAIRFRDRDMSFHVHATVVAKHDKRESKHRSLTLRFLPEERPRQDMVMACAEGEAFPFVRRRHKRIPCRLAARVSMDGSTSFDAIATDISEGGVRLAMAPAVHEGSRISLWLSVPNRADALRTRGRVAYVQRTGAQPGVGVEFEFHTTHERDEVAQQVRSLVPQATERASAL